MSLLLITTSVCAIAQRSDRPITPAEQKQIIDKAFTLLKANYIFPDVLNTMEQQIYKKLSAGSYAAYSTAEDFLKNINNDLETLSNDRHVDIFFDPVRVKQIEAEANSDNSKPAYAPEFLARAKFENYMVRKAERLDGNVGYLKFNMFVDPELSKPTLIAAMNFLSNSSALIIDLRQNGGGDARTCSFLLNYFLPDSTLIMQRRSRTDKTPTLIYTTKDPSARKYDKNIPVYILTSKRSSSAAEAFSYTLQSYKRAVVVGEVTKGEANPGYIFAINKEMYIMIPAFENVNPVTKTNWQGKGVMPDIRIGADKALIVAQAKAYEQLAASTAQQEIRSMYEWMATGLMAEAQPPAVNESYLKNFAGDYADNRKISFAEGRLFYERTGTPNGKAKLMPLKDNLFALEGIPYFRIRFIKSADGTVTALEGLYDDGKVEFSRRLN